MKIEKNHPMPVGRRAVNGKSAELRKVLDSMKPGESFVYHDNRFALRCAQMSGKTITTRKIGPEGYRIWLVK